MSNDNEAGGIVYPPDVLKAARTVTRTWTRFRKSEIGHSPGLSRMDNAVLQLSHVVDHAAEPAAHPPDVLIAAKNAVDHWDRGSHVQWSAMDELDKAVKAAAEPAGHAPEWPKEAPTDAQGWTDALAAHVAAAEPARPPACDCGRLTRAHSTECARYIWEHRNCLPDETGYRAAEPAGEPEAGEQPPEEIIEIDEDGTVHSLGRTTAEPAVHPPDVSERRLDDTELEAILKNSRGGCDKITNATLESLILELRWLRAAEPSPRLPPSKAVVAQTERTDGNDA